MAKAWNILNQVVKRLGKDLGKSLCVWIGSGSSSKGSGKTKDRTALLAVRRVSLNIDRVVAAALTP
jgi:hypothetical protein